MGRAKIPRKSTSIDMTAMCDVAFLLLSFFIMATKQKPSEALAVDPPNSVSSKAAPDKSILITLTKDGRTFLTLGDETKKKEILADINSTRGLNLSAGELQRWEKQDFIGLPLANIKGSLTSANFEADKMPGIPTDSTNNELSSWIRSITNAYAGGNQRDLEKMLLVKGDNGAFYPAFRSIKEALKKNEIYKFRIVTNGEAPPAGSELANTISSGGVDQNNE